MLGLDLNINFLIILLLCYVLYIIIRKNFINNSNNLNLDSNITEGFAVPVDYDPYDKKYKPILKQNVSDIYNRKIKTECLPYSIDYKPEEEKQFKELKPGIESFEGRNFLYAKQHSQVDNVGIQKQKKVDIRPEPINPQLGVDPWTQSIVNIDWANDSKVLQNPKQNKNIWDRLT